mgnify:CR=1 FL=1
MKLLLIFVVGGIWGVNPRGIKWEAPEYDAQEFDESAEVYRIHFYPKTGSEDEYILFKVSFIFFVNFSKKMKILRQKINLKKCNDISL